MELRGVEIDRDRWGEYCRIFAGRHQGWLVEVSEASPGGEREVLAPAAPLAGLGISYRAAPPPAARPEEYLEVVVRLTAADGGEATSLAVVSPLRLTELVRSDGAAAGLEIATRRGEVVDLRFLSPARTDEVNGFVEGRG